MPRRKHAFPTSEIPHLWAHRVQDDGRNPQGNLYFRGDTIYSYRDSYPIASHVTSGEKNAVLIRAGQPYSVTTSGHISAVRSSLPEMSRSSRFRASRRRGRGHHRGRIMKPT